MAYYIWKSYKLKFKPFEIFSCLRHGKNCFFLDSSLNSNYSQGRFSFLGSDPFLTLKSNGLDPFPKLREGMNKYHLSVPRKNIPFWAGAVGYLAYDLGVNLEEKVRKLPKEDLGIPDSFFAFYNTLLIIDHWKKLLHILALGIPEEKFHLQKSLAHSNFKKLGSLLSKISFPEVAPEKEDNRNTSEPESNFAKEKYFQAVRKAKEHIRRGDIYQVNLSQRFQAQTKLSAIEIYRRLRKVSPSYFSAYLDAGDFQILSSSPERFLKLSRGIVTTRPMKGTRARSGDKRKDSGLKRELLNSAKDKAELMMIVDLERNDLGRVCNYNSIKAVRLREIEEYSTVFQTTATLQGRLYKNKDRIDLLRACFPGGSITGCPKIRAMEIIEELEPTRRSIYTGALGYLSFCGNMDFNILIRTILKKKDKLYFGVGGGIVADSEPEAEYEETLVKARGILEAIK